jgi:hypothetical protein
MPSSRSAKEICREYGESDISCKVARNRERRRAESGLHDTPPPESAEPPPTPPPAEPEGGGSIFDLFRGRRGQIEDEIRKGGG